MGEKKDEWNLKISKKFQESLSERPFISKKTYTMETYPFFTDQLSSMKYSHKINIFILILKKIGLKFLKIFNLLNLKMDTENKNISGGLEVFYQNIYSKNKKTILDHSEKFSNIFLTIATSEYLNFSLNLASSIEYAAPNWGMIIFTYGLKKSLLNKIKLTDFLIIINSDFPFDCNSSEDQKAFSSNSRIPILKILTNSYRYNSIFYTDADSILIRDPKEIIYMMDKKKNLLHLEDIPNIYIH